MSNEIEWDGQGEYERQVFEEIQNELKQNDPLAQRVRRVSFISRSAGRYRRRRERGVDLLVVDGEYAHIIKHGEIRERKRNNRIKLDVLANELLYFLPEEERTVNKLLELLTSRKYY